METMKEYTVTAQVYNTFDKYKQTLLVAGSFHADSPDDAEKKFREIYGIDHNIIKVFSSVENTN